jgi:hypothetical protein
VPTVIKAIVAGADDGLAQINTSVFRHNESAVTIGTGGTGNNNNGFFLFKSINVPKNATIISAKIRYRSSAALSGVTCSTRIYFDAADNPSTISSVSDYTGRTKTSQYVDWTIPAWSADTWYDSPNISSIVQEIVNRTGWASGNNMLVLHTNNGASTSAYRQVDAYDITYTVAAELVIEYSEGGTNVTVTASTAEASAEALASIPHADVLVVGGVGEASAEALAANPTTALIVLGAVAEAVAEALPASPRADVLVQASVAESTAEALPATALYNIHVTVLAATAEASAEALPAEPLAQRNITVEAAIGTATAEALAAVVRAGKKLYWVIKYQ